MDAVNTAAGALVEMGDTEPLIVGRAANAGFYLMRVQFLISVRS